MLPSEFTKEWRFNVLLARYFEARQVSPAFNTS